MSMNRLAAAQARNVTGQVSQFGAPRCGIVKSFNPQTYCAKVTFQPEDILSGWLPILSPWVGAGWGLVAPLPPGAQVMVLPDRNDAQQGVIVGLLYSEVDTPPSTAAVGEFLLQHASGAYFTFKNDGSIRSHGTWIHDGDFNATGEVRRGYDTDAVNTLGGHTHKQGSDSGNSTEQPTNPPTAGT
jgi:hypothetical protein